MRFLVRLVNRGKSEPRDVKALASSAYEVVRGYDADVGNLRVSRTAIELDLLLPSIDALPLVTHALEERLGPLLTVRKLDTPAPQMDVDQAIREGLGFFNEERYWESHEALEYAWRRAEGVEKEVLQGIILVAAALVHLQKNEVGVALGVMARASDKLLLYHGERFGISIDRVRETLLRMIDDKRPGFFKIEARFYSSPAAA
jgi:hypothetical protein